MKNIIAISILFCLLSGNAIAALTDADIDKIRLIVSETIKIEIAPIKADIATIKTDAAIRDTEITNIKENINNGFNNVQRQFDNIQKQFDRQNNIVQKQFDRQNNIIIACIGIPFAILAIAATLWGILTQRQIKKENNIQQRIETLTQEIETIKQQRIINH